MCLIFVGIIGKYPQSVITGENVVRFLIHPNRKILKISVFAESDMNSWDVGVRLASDNTVLQYTKKFNEKTRGWDLKVDFQHVPRTSNPRRIIVFVERHNKICNE